jgi:hypothetical protein
MIMQEIENAPQDVIDAIKSLDIRKRVCCNWLTEWLLEDQMLAWAKDSLNKNDQRGHADALTWAKRALCARIDRFLNLCFLSKVKLDNYPSRIKLLREVGIDIPEEVAYKFVIEPRNELEHLYRLPPDQSRARHAVEIAELCLLATEAHLNGDSKQRRCGRVALNWNVLFSMYSSIRNGTLSIKFQGFTNEPMIFVDVFVEPIKVKVIDPAFNEIRFANLSTFSRTQSIELCNLMNQWSDKSQSALEEEYPSEVFRVAKQELGF